jgi:hypothetical protein
MSDEELIRWLRNLEPMDYELRHGTFQAAAANRIEQLKKEVDVWKKLYTNACENLSAKIKELEQEAMEKQHD